MRLLPECQAIHEAIHFVGLYPWIPIQIEKVQVIRSSTLQLNKKQHIGKTAAVILWPEWWLRNLLGIRTRPNQQTPW